MRVQDVMTEDVQTIAPGNAAEDAWELMRTHSFHHVVVTKRHDGLHLRHRGHGRLAGRHLGAAVVGGRGHIPAPSERIPN